ncbi:MAG: group II truncated hemoglobin [Hyphomonadaceae bacterium]|nr:group II truncated hemoglobin [Hyphomonadaceae bacterium]
MADDASRITPYDLVGGAEGVRRLSERFYAIMAQRPEASAIRAMHQADLAPIVDKLASFLSGWMGGPRDYFEREDSPCIMSLHKRYPIGAEERDQWLMCMRAALEETVASAQTRALLEPAFARIADAMRSK